MTGRVATAGAVIAVVGCLWGLLAVLGRERHELEWRSPVRATSDVRDGALVLGEVRLYAGDDVLFEACSDDRLEAARWAGKADAVVWTPGMAGRADDDAVAIRVPFDAASLAQATRNSGGACVRIGHAASLGDGGTFALGLLVHGELPRARFVAHVLAHRPVHGGGAGPLLTVLFGALLAAVALALQRRHDAPAPELPRGRALARVGLGVGALLVAIALTALDPLGGATIALATALLIALVELVVAGALVPRAEGETRAAALGLVSSRRLRVVVVALAPVLGVALFVAGRLVAAGTNAALPPHGEAPIEAFVAWPSARLAVVLVAALAPVAEEVFFRGFVYGALARARGAALAFPLTALLFLAAHLPQVWGDWGAVASLALVSLVLTAVRAATGSTAASAVVHLTHNALIALLSVVAA